MQRLVSLFALLVLLAPATVLAAGKPQRQSFTLYDAAQLGHVKLQPGDYRVEWTQTGDNVPVTLVKDGKTIAQLHAKVVDQKSSYGNAAIDMTKQADGSEALQEVQFSKVAVVFSSAGDANR